MAEVYLLPCPRCNTRLRVTPAQAGQLISCACGAKVDVPTLRDLRLLEPAPAEEMAAGPAPPAWDIGKTISLVGILIMLVGVGVGVLFWVTRPQPYPTERMKPAELWDLWRRFDTRGLPRRYVRTDPFVQEMQARRLWYIFAAGIAIFGLVVAVSARVLPKLFAEEPPPPVFEEEPTEEGAETLEPGVESSGGEGGQEGPPVFEGKTEGS